MAYVLENTTALRMPPDDEAPRPTHKPLHGRRLPLAAAGEQRTTLSSLPLESGFGEALEAIGLWPLRAEAIRVMQINVGKLCNQRCRHCHVDAGPDRTEVMSRDTAELCIEALRRTSIPIVDITGGAPELNPSFRWLVEQCTGLGRHVMSRCNLTVLETGPHRDLPALLAKHRVELVCSLPHYAQACTDVQRGDGVFEKSIRALRRLNGLGYGRGDTGLRLVLVTNPVGARLPGPQACLESEWKRELERRHGVHFDALYTITNMPISRYLEFLLESGQLETYMTMLVESFNPQAAHGVMCRNTISVGWDGRLFDCDFNQMLDIEVSEDVPRYIQDFDIESLRRRTIQTGLHCFGCTAGTGSSCTGSISTGPE